MKPISIVGKEGTSSPSAGGVIRTSGILMTPESVPVIVYSKRFSVSLYVMILCVRPSCFLVKPNLSGSGRGLLRNYATPGKVRRK